MALMSSSLIGNPNQLTGSLNDLVTALQRLQQALSGKQAPSWEQDARRLEAQMTSIWQVMLTCSYGADDVKEYKNLLGQYRQLIKANNAELSYHPELESYAVLPFEAEMNCLIAQFDQIMDAKTALDPQLIKAYEMVYSEYIKEAPVSKIDPAYKGWLEAVRVYVTQPTAGTETKKPSRPLPPTPGKKPAPKVTGHIPPPPPPLLTGSVTETKEPKAEPSESKPAPTTSKPKISLEELGKGASGLKQGKPSQSKPTRKLSEQEKAVLKRRGALEITIEEEEAREEAERMAEDIARAEQQKKLEEAKRLEQERKKQETQLQQRPPSPEELAQRKKFEEAARAAAEEAEEGEEWGPEESVEEALKKEKEQEARRERTLVDNTTKNKFALTQNENEKAGLNKQRRDKGLAELPGDYLQGEEQQMRDYYDKESRRNYLFDPRLKTEGTEAVRNEINANRSKYGFEKLGSQYPQQFEEFKKKQPSEGLNPQNQKLYDETVLQLFIEKDLYKNRPDKLREALDYINQERKDNKLSSLTL